MGISFRRQDLVAFVLMLAAGVGLTIDLLSALGPFGFWLGAVVPGVMISALWIGLLLDAAVRFELVAAERLQHVTRAILAAFFLAWIVLGLTLHLGATGAPLGAALAAVLLMWGRRWPETWPEFRREA